MKIIRFMISGKFTLILVAILSGVYLFQTFGNENSWDEMMILIKGNLFVRIIISLFYMQIFIKGVYRLSKGITRYFASALFFISLSLIISGIYFSMVSRNTEKHRMNISDTTDKGLQVVDIIMDIPDEILVVGESSEFKIKNPEAVITVDRKTMSLRPYPFVKTSSGYAYINDAGISPSLDLNIGEKRIFLSKLEMLPPNKDTSIQLTSDYKMEIAFSPERKFKKGRLSARQYNLQVPQYRVVMKQGDGIIFDKVLGDYQAEENRDFSLNFGSSEKWVEIVFVRDKTVFIIYAGLIGLFFGILFYPVELYRNFR